MLLWIQRPEIRANAVGYECLSPETAAGESGNELGARVHADLVEDAAQVLLGGGRCDRGRGRCRGFVAAQHSRRPAPHGRTGGSCADGVRSGRAPDARRSSARRRRRAHAGGCRTVLRSRTSQAHRPSGVRRSAGASAYPATGPADRCDARCSFSASSRCRHVTVRMRRSSRTMIDGARSSMTASSSARQHGRSSGSLSSAVLYCGSLARICFRGRGRHGALDLRLTRRSGIAQPSLRR